MKGGMNDVMGLLVFVLLLGAAADAVTGNHPAAAAPPPVAAPAPPPASSGAGVVYSFAQLQGALAARGMSASRAVMGARVAEAESGGSSDTIHNTWYPNLPGYSPPRPGDGPEYSVGAWQINVPVHKGVTVACAMELNCAAGAAFAISSGGATWSAWSTCNPRTVPGCA